MSRKPFHFKEFSVEQTDVTMPVTTDACLLGAIASFQPKDSVLDIGTGTGLLCLMLAQRFRDLQLTGIELDESTAEIARKNAINSPWSDRISILQGDARVMPLVQYHGIIVNPPFFENQLPSAGAKKLQARHSDTLSYAELSLLLALHLRPDGVAWLLFPATAFHSLEKELNKNGLFADSILSVHPNENKAANVLIVSLRFEKNIPKYSQLIVYSKPNEYTEQTKSLLSLFYLNL